ncbi:MAG: proteasome accessory factor PafA2 family protein [Fimbriimonadaceae bacterium]
MDRILAGIETEYGLYVEGRGAEDQIEDAMALVRSYPGECLASWDYRYESPRADLRGFKLDRLEIDPKDAQFDRGKAHPSDHEVRSDRILPNGARLYNDHGHPEYATPECWSTAELALQDRAGELAVLQSAEAMAAESGRAIRIYKNNTDFHGASYGTHESYLVPRALGFDALVQAVLPMLVVRQVLCGAGKVGAETGPHCSYQLSQRADFLVEQVNAETLYRRPIFNTRDEPHARHGEWIRLHVICGDANMLSSATARKVGLVKLALSLATAGEAPVWKLKDPVAAFKSISRDESYEFRVELEGRSWTNASEILESYFAASDVVFGPNLLAEGLVRECRQLLADLRDCPERFASSVDWAAKRAMLEAYMASEGSDWRDPALRSFDLEYHNISPDEGLFYALPQSKETASQAELMVRLAEPTETTRALPRSLAVARFKDLLVTACWRSLTFEIEGKRVEVELFPDKDYPAHLREVSDVVQFIEMLRGVE